MSESQKPVTAAPPASAHSAKLTECPSQKGSASAHICAIHLCLPPTPFGLPATWQLFHLLRTHTRSKHSDLDSLPHLVHLLAGIPDNDIARDLLKHNHKQPAQPHLIQAPMATTLWRMTKEHRSHKVEDLAAETLQARSGQCRLTDELSDGAYSSMHGYPA
eukprot:1074792-Pelagomonas_calceolata.AAC.2